MNNEVAVRESTPVAIAQPGELSVEQVLAQVAKIQTLMQSAMHENEHYGVIPGTGSKPTLLKAGAEKLCLMFRLDPQYEVEERQNGDHLTIISRCTLYHIGSGARMGSGMGLCSTRESKYAYRHAQRTCPQCGAAAVFKDKKGPGYYCWAKKEGCGAQFKTADEIKAIEAQETGRVANPDIADQYNTVLKMANKRSLIAAILNVTAASDIFTQDLEDIHEKREAMEPDDSTGSGRPDAEVIQRPKDTDRATAEVRNSLWATICRAHHGDKDAATKWVRAYYSELGMTRWEDLKVSGVKFLVQMLEEFARSGASQAPAPDPIDDPANIPFDGNEPPAAPTDEPGPSPEPERAQPVNGPFISDAQAKRMYALAKGDGAMLNSVLAGFNIGHSRDVPKRLYDDVCKVIQASAALK